MLSMGGIPDSKISLASPWRDCVKSEPATCLVQSTPAHLEMDPLVDVSTWATTRRAGLCSSASVNLTRAVWDAIEKVPLESVASSDVVQRLHAVLSGAARAVAGLPRGVDTPLPASGAPRVIRYLARLQTRIDGPHECDFVVMLAASEAGTPVLTIDCGDAGH